MTTTAVVHRWRWAGLAALLTAEAMNLLDTTIVQVAGPTIRAGLGATASDVQWFSAAYTLPFAVLLITGGRLGDAVGRRRVFLIGVAGFAAASLACALAPSAGLLIAARVVQGAAAAAIVPQTFGLIRAVFTGPELARALGMIGPVMGLAAICGPPLGAAVTVADIAGTSWRAAFLVNLPLAAAVLLVAPLLREDRAATPPGLDPVGTLLAVAGAGLLTYPLIQPGTPVALAGAGLLVLAGFVAHQRATARRGRPTLVETSLFRDAGFGAALVASTPFFAVMNGLMFVIVLHLQLGAGRGVLAAGLTLIPWSAGSAVASLVAGTYLVPRFGARTMLAGLAVLAPALAATAMTLPQGTGVPALAALAVAGLGLGLFTVPFFTAALSRVDGRETGSAAGLLNAVQQLGATLGVAVLGTVYLRGLGASPGSAVATTIGVALVLVACTAIAAAVLVRRTR